MPAPAGVQIVVVCATYMLYIKTIVMPEKNMLSLTNDCGICYLSWWKKKHLGCVMVF